MSAHDVAVAGVGMHPWGKWGRNFVEYGVHAARAALADSGIAWSDVDAKYRALMPDSKLAAPRIEESLRVIHGFEKVKNVAELIRLLRPTS